MMGFSFRIRLSCALTLGFVTGCQTSPLFQFHPRQALENILVYYPKRFPEGDWDDKSSKFEDVWFESDDGTKLNGWFAPAENPRAVLLYCHGNGGNVSTRQEPLHLFSERLGTSILVFDYRGYGKSEGHPFEKGIYADARAARKWLSEKTGMAEEEIILLGNSMGGGVAIELASKDGAPGLILESTFTSIPEVGKFHARGFPVRWMMTTRFDSIKKIGNYHGPLLQAHGDADKIVPYPLGKKLHRAANEPKEFISIPGGGHSDPPSPEYFEALDRFIESLTRKDLRNPLEKVTTEKP